MESTKIIPDVYSVLSYGEIAPDALTLVGVMTQPGRIWLAQNFTNVFITGSQDGFNDNIMLPPGGFVLLDLGTNKGTPNTATIPAGYGLWVVPYLDAPTSGFVVFSYWYSG